MRKSITIATIITGFVVSGALFAMSSYNSAAIAKMQESVHAFELAGQLNGGATDLTSAPLVGKRTWEYLTAAEYNRLLELLGMIGTDTWATGWAGSNITTQVVRANCSAAQASQCTATCPTWTTIVWGGVDWVATNGTCHVVESRPSGNGWSGGTAAANSATTSCTASVEAICASGGWGTWSTSGWDTIQVIPAVAVASTWPTKANLSTTSLDLSTITWLTVPTGAKAVLLQANCNNYATQNAATILTVNDLTVCRANSLGSTNDTNDNFTIAELTGGNTITYSYSTPDTEVWWQIALRAVGFVVGWSWGGSWPLTQETIITSIVQWSLENAWKNGNTVSCPAGTSVHNWGIRRSRGVTLDTNTGNLGWFYCENNGNNPTTGIQARMHSRVANANALCEIWAACR